MKVVITDYWYESLANEQRILSALPDVKLEAYHCKEEETLCRLVADADAVIVQFAPITARIIASMKHCKLIVRYAIGVDNIDLEAAAAKGIYVANVPDYSIDEVSDHAIALIFALTKKLFPLAASVRAGKWDYTVSKPLYRLRGKTLGLISFGRIAQMVARKMAAFGVKVLCYDPYISPQYVESCNVRAVDLETLLESSDFLSVHCPLTKQTHHLLNAAAFERMKPSAILINTARGGVIDTEALVEALKSSRLAGAGLDVVEQEPIQADNPLLQLENVILTPHNAWYSEEAIVDLQCKVAQEVVRVLSGKKPLHPVNHPVFQEES